MTQKISYHFGSQISAFCKQVKCTTNGQLKNDLNRSNVSNLLLTKITV